MSDTSGSSPKIEDIEKESIPEMPHKAWVIAFGVSVCIKSDSVKLLEDAVDRSRKALVGNLEIIPECSTPHEFSLFRDNGTYVLHHDGQIARHSSNRRYFLKSFESMLRIKIAEYAYNRVFLHAGVVGWKGKAVIFPGDSFDGKSTLAAEFVRAGADYYSDEYAVLDSDGLVHAFPRLISIRRWNVSEEIFDVSEIPAESLGGTIGRGALPVGWILFTKYDENAVWAPTPLTPGKAVIEIISQTIPIRYAPEFSLKVLKKITSNAILLKSNRGDAREFVESFLDFVDNKAL
jgi:hypothetical protein